MLGRLSPILSCAERLMWEWVVVFIEPSGMELQKRCFIQHCFTSRCICMYVCMHTYIHSKSHPGAHIPFTGQVYWWLSSWLVTLDWGHVRAFGITITFAMAIAFCRLVLRRGG